MNRLGMAVMTMALAGTLVGTAGAETRTYFGFQIGVGNAPPPPVFVYAPPPPMYYEPAVGVYVAEGGYDGCDVFRYGNYWYANDDGYWYRSGAYGGPYAVVDVRYVPRPIFYVPQRHWHRYPTPLAGYYRVHQSARPAWWNSSARYDNRSHYPRSNDNWNRSSQRNWGRGNNDDNWNHGRDRDYITDYSRGRGDDGYRDDQGRGHGNGKGKGHG